MIELINLKKSFNQHIAVDNISLKVKSGEIFGFLGPNGAGKTTCIRMLNGIIPPTEGQILLNDMDIAIEPVACKQITGYVPDRPWIYERLKGWEFIEFICDLYNIRNQTSFDLANYYLERFEIAFAKDKLIQDYSHGMKQKLIISCALLHDPQILVIDEPMVGLDPKGAKTLKALFHELAEAGKTIFLSTHTMSVAEEVCDRIGIINFGKILACGTMQELQDKTASDASLEELFLKITSESAQAIASH